MDRRKIFHRYQRRFVPLAALFTLVGTWFVLTAALVTGGWFGTALVASFLWLVCDRMVLFGNGWLQRKVRDKVVALGELRSADQAYFVGLAHPCHADNLKRRMIETDDDIGYLTISWSGLQFRGDANSFDLPACDIVDVRLVRSLFAPWGRIEIRTCDGEPYESIILSSRGFGSHTACRVETANLYERLRGIVMLNTPLRPERLTADYGAPVLEALLH